MIDSTFNYAYTNKQAVQVSKGADTKEMWYTKQAQEAKKAEEAEKKAKREAEQAAKERAKREAEQAAKERAKREAEEAKERAKGEAEEAKEKAKREAEQAAQERAKREAEEAKERAKGEAEEAKEKAKGEAEEKVSDELYEGMVKLVIASPVEYDQMRELGEYLRQVQNLHLVLVGGSVEEGTKIVVSAEKPIRLVTILREMPPVEQVAKKGKEIQVTLKAKQ